MSKEWSSLHYCTLHQNEFKQIIRGKEKKKKKEKGENLIILIFIWNKGSLVYLPVYRITMLHPMCYILASFVIY